jgi:hypothetical protein
MRMRRPGGTQHLGLEHFRVTLAVRLGRVHRGVGVAHQPLHVADAVASATPMLQPTRSGRPSMSKGWRQRRGPGRATAMRLDVGRRGR